MRASEWVIIGFFTLTTMLALALPVQINIVKLVLLTNASALWVYVAVWALRAHTWVEYARDWIPQAAAMVAYQEMGLFAGGTHQHVFEHQWIGWDRLLLDAFHIRAGLETLGGTLPLLLELSYLLVYAVPAVTVCILYGLGMRPKVDLMATIYLVSLFLCYAQFPFWPSEPPRVVFMGQDLPSFDTPVRHLNLWLVSNHGIHTSVFPSAHVSGVFATMLGFLYIAPGRRKLIVAYFVYAVLVALATVYGRYHYAVDAFAGFVIGVISPALGVWVWRLVNNRKSEAHDILPNLPAGEQPFPRKISSLSS